MDKKRMTKDEAADAMFAAVSSVVLDDEIRAHFEAAYPKEFADLEKAGSAWLDHNQGGDAPESSKKTLRERLDAEIAGHGLSAICDALASYCVDRVRDTMSGSPRRKELLELGNTLFIAEDEARNLGV